MGGAARRRLVAAASPAAAALLVAAAFLISPAEAAAAETTAAGEASFDSIFAFGDSFTDTGNNPVVFGWYDVFDVVMRPPYGMTFFGGRPTGRNSNGRLIIDFIAQGLGLPLVPPYLSHNGSFRQGANFAVGGATALNSSFFHVGDAPGASLFPLNTSLEVQLGWFDDLKPSLCKTDQECKDFFGRSLFFVGEFGINDYQYSFGKKSMQEIRDFVPDLIQIISMGAERVIAHGAKTVVIPGMIPSGCAPPVLVTFANADASEYDAATGCLKEPNEIVTLHNSLLLDAVDKLRAEHPDVTIIHTDLFNHVMEMVESPEKFGGLVKIRISAINKFYRTSAINGIIGFIEILSPIKFSLAEGVGGTTTTCQWPVATKLRRCARIHPKASSGTASTSPRRLTTTSLKTGSAPF